MAKEFFDDDLVNPGAAAYPTVPAGGSTPAAAENRSVYGRKKREIPEQVNQATDEIDRLRQRQESLERRKQELVDQRRRIEAFEHNRRDMLDKLGRSTVLVVREGEQASRMAALCTEVSSLFSKLHQEMETFAPERWTEEEYDAQLTQALAKVESAGAEYRRAMDGINALTWNRSSAKGGDDIASLSSGTADGRRGPPATFVEWLLAGVAFTLPVLILLGGILVLVILRNNPA